MIREIVERIGFDRELLYHRRTMADVFGSIPIHISGFTNDMTTFHFVNDVFSLLIHLSYLNYDRNSCCVCIPNKEFSEVYTTSIMRIEGWAKVMRFVEAAKKLLQSMWNMNADTVTKGIDRAHDEILILKYNDEKSLSCTINLTFYYTKEYYTIIRELFTGKGFADICLILHKLHADKPEVMIELKKDKDEQWNINQIKQKNCVTGLRITRVICCWSASTVIRI